MQLSHSTSAPPAATPACYLFAPFPDVFEFGVSITVPAIEGKVRLRR